VFMLCKLSTMSRVEKKKNRQQLSIIGKQKIYKLAKKTKKSWLTKFSLQDTKKKLKLNVDHHIKIDRNHNFLQV